jgi:hypothetical protein
VYLFTDSKVKFSIRQADFSLPSRTFVLFRGLALTSNITNNLPASGQENPSEQNPSEQASCARKYFDARMDRLCEALNVSSDAALARALGIKRQSIVSSRSRKQLPYAWVVDAASKFNLSTDWLLFGDGPVRRGEKRDEATKDVQRSDQAEAEVEGEGDEDISYDPEILETVVEGMEEWLKLERLTLEPDKKAKLVVVLYEYCMTLGRVDKRTIDKYLRLVA